MTGKVLSARFVGGVAAVAALLLVCMVLHPFIPHEHAEDAFGTGLQATLHSDERRWLGLLLALVAFAWALSRGATSSRNRSPATSVRHPVLPLLFHVSENHLREAFRTGILHTKLCG